MPKLDSTIEEVRSPNHRRAHHLKLTGIISSPTIDKFKSDIDKSTHSGLDLVLDLSGVHYVNSTALGYMLNLREELQLKDCNMVVVGIMPEVMNLVQLLGLDKVLPIRDDIAEALSAIDEGVFLDFEKEEPQAETLQRGAKAGKVLIPIGPPKPLLPEAKIILGFKGNNHITRLITRCFTGNDDKALIAPSKQDFAKILGKGKVDVAILDSELPDFNEIAAMLKTDAENGLVSIITIYSGDKERENAHAFRVVEDEFVIEPFDVREIIAAVEREYTRCKDEGILFRQEAEFDFEGSDEQVNQAAETIANMLSSVDMDTTARDSFIYAVREGIDNARKHGNKLSANKHIDLLYILDREKITITIQDEGDGFDYEEVISSATKSSPIERARQNHKQGKQGGLGISLMLRCCDKLEFIPPGNVVRLTKYF